MSINPSNALFITPFIFFYFLFLSFTFRKLQAEEQLKWDGIGKIYRLYLGELSFQKGDAKTLRSKHSSCSILLR